MASKVQMTKDRVGVITTGSLPKRELSITPSARSLILVNQLKGIEYNPISKKIIFSTGTYSLWNGSLSTTDTLYLNISSLLTTRIIFSFFINAVISLILQLDFDFYETVINENILYQSSTNPLGVALDELDIEFTTGVDLTELDILSSILLPINKN